MQDVVLMADQHEYVISLLRSRENELDGLKRQWEEGLIAEDDYLSCRLALKAGIRELNSVLAHLQSRTDRANGKGEEWGREVLCGHK